MQFYRTDSCVTRTARIALEVMDTRALDTPCEEPRNVTGPTHSKVESALHLLLLGVLGGKPHGRTCNYDTAIG
jgi:hypothetical protein